MGEDAAVSLALVSFASSVLVAVGLEVVGAEVDDADDDELADEDEDEDDVDEEVEVSSCLVGDGDGEGVGEGDGLALADGFSLFAGVAFAPEEPSSKSQLPERTPASIDAKKLNKPGVKSRPEKGQPGH